MSVACYTNYSNNAVFVHLYLLLCYLIIFHSNKLEFVREKNVIQAKVFNLKLYGIRSISVYNKLKILRLMHPSYVLR